MLCTCETQGTLQGTLQWSPGAVTESTTCFPAAFICNFYSLFVWFSVQSNIALFKPTSQSSTQYDYYASNAVDGEKGSHYTKCTQTNQERDPWWRVDLGRVEPVAEVNILNRDSTADRLDGAEMRVGR